MSDQAQKVSDLGEKVTEQPQKVTEQTEKSNRVNSKSNRVTSKSNGVRLTAKQRKVLEFCDITPRTAHDHDINASGRTIASNCQMLCRECNRRKSSK